MTDLLGVSLASRPLMSAFLRHPAVRDLYKDEGNVEQQICAGEVFKGPTTSNSKVNNYRAFIRQNPSRQLELVTTLNIGQVDSTAKWIPISTTLSCADIVASKQGVDLEILANNETLTPMGEVCLSAHLHVLEKAADTLRGPLIAEARKEAGF